MKLQGYADANLIGYTKNHKSTTCSVYTRDVLTCLEAQIFRLLYCLPQKLSMLPVESFTRDDLLQIFLEELGKITRKAISLMIVRVPCSSPRILLFILGPKISISGMISFHVYLRMTSWYFNFIFRVDGVMLAIPVSKWGNC